MLKPALAAAALLATLVAGEASAASANQFDLVCKGSEQKKTGAPATPWTEHFRVDLDAKRWCRASCTAAAPIDTFDADTISISDSRAATGGPSEVQLTLFRTTGKVREAIAMGWSGGDAELAQGTCRREFFSGFPAQKF